MIRAFLKKVGLLPDKKVESPKFDGNIVPTVIPRSQHCISRADISENALKVLYRLHNHGYEAYLVGGGVRDLLLGLHPKDFDIVTNAKPEEVRSVFRNCRLIGRRFRLAHVYFGHDIIEVATFRGTSDASSQEGSHSAQGMILRDNVYGTMAEDVWRRDITINALYYNIADFSVVDYVGGYADLNNKKLRMIGSPLDRFREDPVRMLRVIRFACKVNFKLSEDLAKPMAELKELINHVSSARLFEEVMKMFHSGAALATYELLIKYDLFAQLFPATATSFAQKTYPLDALLKIVFQNTDRRIAQEKTVTPAFIVAALLWYPICLRAQSYIDSGTAFFPARMQAMEELLSLQAKRLSIPKRITQGARDIWLLQMRLPKRNGKRALQMMSELRFRAAFDFLELRAQAGEPIQELVNWWQAFIEGDGPKRRALIKALSSNRKTNRT